MTEELERLVATRRIIEVSYRYASGIDLRDWDLYRTCFTDPCTFDFSSFSGRPPSSMPAQVWVDNVRSLNGNFDATQHVMTNHSISFSGSDKAVCVTELRAQHWFSPATMVQFGRDGEENWCEFRALRNSMMRIDLRGSFGFKQIEDFVHLVYVSWSA